MGNLYASRTRVGADSWRDMTPPELRSFVPAPAGTMVTSNPAFEQRQRDMETQRRHQMEVVAAVGIGGILLTVGIPTLAIILIIKAIKK